MLEINQAERGNSLSRTGPPPTQRKNGHKRRYTNRIIHIYHCDWSDWREEQDHADEQHPGNRNAIQRSSPLPERKWALDELDLIGVQHSSKDYGDVGQVEGWGGNAEDCDYGLLGADSDEVEADAAEYNKPDRVDRRVRVWVYLAPETKLQNTC